MPRYEATSPFGQDLLGLRVGIDGVAVFPANGRPDPLPGTTVHLELGDEIEAPTELHFPGAYRLDAPQPQNPPPPPGAPSGPAATPAEEPAQ